MKSLVKSNMLKSNKNVSGVVKPYAGNALCTILTCIIFLFLNPHNFIRADGYMFYINAFWKVCCPPIINLSLITLLTFHTPRFLLRKRCSNFPFWQTLLGAESSSKTNCGCVHWITPVKATRFVLTNQQHRIKKEKFGIRLSCFRQAKEFIILIR